MAKLTATKISGIKQNPQTKDYYASWRMPIIDEATGKGRPMSQCPQLICKIVKPDGTPARNITEAKNHRAVCVAAKEAARVASHRDESGERMTLDDLCELAIAYRRDVKKAADNGLKTYTNCFNRLYRYGLDPKMCLEDVTEEKVLAARSRMLGPKSASRSTNTVNQTIGKLQSAWNILVKDSDRKAQFKGLPNPCAEISPVEHDQGSDELRKHLLDAELATILKAVNDGPSPEFWRPMVAACLGLGLRISEAVNLKKEDIGPRENKKGIWLKVRSSKTKAGRRTLQVGPSTLAELRSRMTDLNPWLFPSPADSSQPISKSRCDKYLADIMGQTGIEILGEGGTSQRWHAFRHTYAIHLLLKHGRGLSDLKSLLGHATIAITDRHYGCLLPTDVSEETSMLSDMLVEQSAPGDEERKTA